MLSSAAFSEESGKTSKTVSQGSISEGPGVPEEDFPAYTQVVDNGATDFRAPGWKSESSVAGHYGEDYAVAPSPKARAAEYRVGIPATDTYSLYVWLPQSAGNTSAARFGVTTATGTRWTEIDQRRDGGFWGKLGEYRMKKGESYAIKVAPGPGGRTVADAVAVVRGVLSGPPEDENVSSSGADATFQAASGTSNGWDVMRKARRYLGTPYKWGTCTTSRMSCTCLTRKSFAPFGHTLPMSETKQWQYAKNRGKVIRSKANLRPGDILFFKERGSSGPITHVGVAARSGWIVHSSSYFGRVVEKQHRYIRGFHAGVRLRLR